MLLDWILVDKICSVVKKGHQISTSTSVAEGKVWEGRNNDGKTINELIKRVIIIFGKECQASHSISRPVISLDLKYCRKKIRRLFIIT